MQSILIVEDDTAIQQRMQRVLARALPQSKSCFAGSLAEARVRLADQRFDLVLLDVGLPDGLGLELLPWLQSHAPTTETVVLTSFGDDGTLLRAIRGGAVGYLLKSGDDIEIEMALGCMARGGAPIDPVIGRRILQLMTSPAPPEAPEAPPRATAAPAEASALSERELDVLRLVSQGQSNREIAQHLFVSINTVECHAKSIYRKLAVRSRGAAVFSARSRGLLS